jgi:hypothetical protein
MHRSHVLLSVLLAMLFGGCTSFGKKFAEVQHNTAVAKSDCTEGDKRLLGIAKLTQRFEKISRTARQKYYGETEALTNSDEGSCSRYNQWTNFRVNIQSKTPDRPLYRYDAQIAPNGTKIILYDANDDGSIDARIEEKPEKQVLLQTYLMDTDDDGVFDERISNTFHFEKGENHCVVEKIIWKTTLEKTEARKAPFPPEMKVVPKTREKFRIVRTPF